MSAKSDNGTTAASINMAVATMIVLATGIIVRGLTVTSHVGKKSFAVHGKQDARLAIRRDQHDGEDRDHHTGSHSDGHPDRKSVV